MTYTQAAITTMLEVNQDKVWVGDPNVWHEIYYLKNGHNNAHPIDQWKAVYSALSKSELFEIRGYIKAPGFTTIREIAHPVFGLRPKKQTE